MNIKDVLESKKADLLKKQTHNNILNSKIKKNCSTIETKSIEFSISREALQFLEDVAQSRRNTMKEKIESILTEAIRTIYGSDYKIQLLYSVKNNRSSLEIEMVKGTPSGAISRDIDGFGGGVADVISVPLRLLILLGSRQTDRVCILDESYKHMDLERIEEVAKFIKTISQKLGIQIILCSHHEAMQVQANKIYVLSDDNGKAKVN